jgi:thymidine kinase
MAKLYFNYSTMNAGKSQALLQSRFNYLERGMNCLLLTAAIDNRFGTAKITSRLGISADAQIFAPGDDLMQKFLLPAKEAGMACILVDEAQFLTWEQVQQLARAVDILELPVMAFGLRTDFRGQLFEGSSALLAIADSLTELKTICHCGRKGIPTLEGDQIQIGGNDTYVALCRKHWMKAHAEVRTLDAQGIAAE